MTALLPHDVDAEESVVGAILLPPLAGFEPVLPAVVETGLRGSDFYRPSLGAIYDAAVSLYADAEPVDAITVANRLAETGTLADVGGVERVHELAALVPSAGNAVHYAEIVREQAVLRALAAAAAEISRSVADRDAPTDELLERAESTLFAVSERRDSAQAVWLKTAVRDAFQRLQTLDGNEVSGLATGFRWLDRLTGGLQPGNFVIVAARPSLGKTSLALAIAANVAVRADLPVVLFTLEMNAGEVTQRLLCAEAHVELQQLRTGNVGVEGWQRLSQAATRLEPAPLLLDESASLTALELRSKARRYKMQNPRLALVIVDYLQLMTSGGRVENRNQDVSQISRMLKVLAGELQVPVLALSQLSRSVEGRHDKRPMLSDLRESGSLEQDSDVVGLLYRADYYSDEALPEEQGVAELHLAKHRNGPTGVVKLAFQEKYARFTDLAIAE